MTNSVCTLCCDGCKEHGERVERERIIDLLKELLGYGDEDWDECVCAIIASIKRENK